MGECIEFCGIRIGRFGVCIFLMIEFGVRGGFSIPSAPPPGHAPLLGAVKKYIFDTFIKRQNLKNKSSFIKNENIKSGHENYNI